MFFKLNTISTRLGNKYMKKKRYQTGLGNTDMHKKIYKKQGLAMGVVVGGFGGGAFIFNQIQVEKIIFK